jgi:hypothetical protein
MKEFKATNPRQEAQELLPAGFEARVLEPSPPAVNEGEYKADDPAAANGRQPSRQLVTPTTAGDVTWDALAHQFSNLREFVADHWLGAWHRLGTIPETYDATTAGLSQLAFFAMAPARFEQNGKVGLRYTFRGFGTPFYGRDRQVRIEDQYLVIQDGDSAIGHEITTIRDAARLAGVDYRERWGPDWHDPPAPTDPDTPLEIDPAAVLVCSNIIGCAYSVLEQIRFEAREEEKPSRVQVWPEHFDVGLEIGDEAHGRRAEFGVSPGYPAHPEPYVYVSPWVKEGLDDPYWNADAFGGSSLRYSELVTAENQRESALDFLRTGLELLRAR